VKNLSLRGTRLLPRPSALVRRLGRHSKFPHQRPRSWPERARSGTNEAAEGARRSVAESEKMSNRTIALLVLAVVVAAAVTVEVTYFVLDRFVLHDPNDPLTKAGGLSQDQRAKRK
jgi:hypothetical protein